MGMKVNAEKVLKFIQHNQKKKIGITLAGMTIALLGGVLAAYFAHPGAHALSLTVEHLALPMAWGGMIALPLAWSLTRSQENRLIEDKNKPDGDDEMGYEKSPSKIQKQEKKQMTRHLRNEWIGRLAAMVALTAGAILACHFVHFMGHKMTPVETLAYVSAPLVTTVAATNIALARMRLDPYNSYDERLS